MSQRSCVRYVSQIFRDIYSAGVATEYSNDTKMAEIANAAEPRHCATTVAKKPKMNLLDFVNSYGPNQTIMIDDII